jgi:serine/threonine protein kinase
MKLHVDYDKLEEDLLVYNERLPDYLSKILSDESEFYPIYEELLENKQSNFQRLEEIARGGEKKIIKVYDPKTDRKLALARPIECEPVSYMEKFLREARITALLEHPNILGIYELGLDKEDVPYFAMQFIDGDNLEDIGHKLKTQHSDYLNDYPLNKRLEIFFKICDAISYAHSKGVIHLDIKPANIQVGSFGEVLVCDWGISRIQGQENAKPEALASEEYKREVLNDITLKKSIKGSPGFIAPEIITAKQTPTFSADIYSLGAVLYFLLTYVPPIPYGNSLENMLALAVKGKIKLPSERSTTQSIPSGIEAITMKALATDPADRYQTVKELQQDLERFSAGFAPKAEEVTLLDQLKLLLKRNKRVASVTCIALMIIFSLAVISFIKINKERLEAIAARKEAVKNKNEAINNKNEALRALGKYDSELQISSTLRTEMGHSLTSEISINDYSEAFQKIAAIEKILHRDIQGVDQKIMRYYYGMLLFVTGDYDKSFSYLEASNERNARELIELMEEHDLLNSPLIPRDKTLIVLQNLPHILNEVCFYSYFYFYIQNKNLDKKQLYPLAAEVLLRMNASKYDIRRRWTDHYIKIEKIGTTGYSKLAGTPYTNFSLPIKAYDRDRNMLRHLGVDTIDLSDSPESTWFALMGTNPKSLVCGHLSSMNKIQLSKLKLIDRAYYKSTDNLQALQAALPNTSLIQSSDQSPYLSQPRQGQRNFRGRELSWNRLNKAKKYQVYISNGRSEELNLLTKCNTTQTSIPKLLPNSKYYWRIDTHLEDGSISKGKLFYFYTRTQKTLAFPCSFNKENNQITVNESKYIPEQQYGSDTSSKSMIFNGIDDYASCQDLNALAFDENDAFSLSFTINTNQKPNGDVPVISTKNWLRKEYRGWGLGLNKTGCLSIITGDRARFKELHSTTVINDGLTHTIRLSFNDGLKLVSMDIDGRLEGSIEAYKNRGVQRSPYPLTVGCGSELGKDNPHFFKGTLSDLTFYSHEQ